MLRPTMLSRFVLGPPAPPLAGPHPGGGGAPGAAAAVSPVADADAPEADLVADPGPPPEVVPPWVIGEPSGGHYVGEAVTLPRGASHLGGHALALMQGEVVKLRFLQPGTRLRSYVATRKE